jgi:hypothetical protein
MLKSLIVDDKLNEYISDFNSYKVSNIMYRMYKEAINDIKPNYNTPINQLQFLKLLVYIANPKKVLELGVFRGLSTLAIGEAIQDQNAKIISCDITDEYLINYKKYWQEARIDHLIDLWIGKANDLLDQLIEDSGSEIFDFTYIDANKSEYLNYYEKSVKLTRSGGLIVIDNILWKGRVVKDEFKDNITNSIRDLNFRIKNDNRVNSVMLAIEDGLQIVRKI